MELQDFIAESNGISLHRQRVLNAFSHVAHGPLIDVLFNLTRPTLRGKDVTVAPEATGKSPRPKIIRKGMVNYRRELHGLTDVRE